MANFNYLAPIFNLASYILNIKCHIINIAFHIISTQCSSLNTKYIFLKHQPSNLGCYFYKKEAFARTRFVFSVFAKPLYQNVCIDHRVRS